MIEQRREVLSGAGEHPSGWPGQVVRSDEHLVLLRTPAAGERPATLMLVPGQDRAPPSVVLRLEREYAVRDQLDPAWAVVPTALTYERGRRALLLEDPRTELLSAWVGKPLDRKQFLLLALGLARALARLHATALVHGDVRPSNVFVDAASGTARLTGFGFATGAHAAGAPPRLVGASLAYLSPEQTGRMNRSVDARSDLYSYGVTLYEMLSGRLPFSAVSPMEWVHSHLAKPPVPVDQQVPGIPPRLAAIIMKLLAKAPEERYQTAAGVAADLQRCLTDGPQAQDASDLQLGRDDVPDRLSLPQRTYGRSREAAELLAAFDRVASAGSTELFLVSGPSGIGKSMIVGELDSELVARPGAFSTGKVDQYKGTVPYAPLLHAFGSLVRRLLTRPEGELARWQESLRTALGANGRLICELLPELELIIGPQPPVAPLPPQNARHRFHLVFRQFLGVFARADHPLALFLDDLQWLDTGTLEFMEHLVTHPEVRHLLIVGAYRSNEVEEQHPLVQTLERIRAAGGRTRRIELEPVGVREATDLLIDALRASEPDVEPLARLVIEKTGGNPFFVKQFVQELNDARMLSFDATRGAWRWDLDQMRRRPVTDNVVDLIIQRIERLPLDMKPILGVLATYGTAVGAGRIALVAGVDVSAAERALEEAKRAGLVGQSGPEYFFVHDRVEEAAHRLIPEDERPAVHLRIARELSEGRPGDEHGELLFDVVHHLQRGVSRASTRDEHLRLASLLVASGKRAKAASSFSTALSYFIDAGAALATVCGAGRDPFVDHPELAFAAAFNQAECELIAGGFEAAEARLASLAALELGLPNLAAVTALRIGICMAFGRFDRGVGLGLEYLERAGSPVPAAPTKEDLDAEYHRILHLLAGRPFRSLAELPLTADAAHAGTLEVIYAMQSPSLFGHHASLHSLLGCRMVTLSLEHGLVPHSSAGFMWFGMIVGPRFGDYASTHDLGQLALAMVERHELDGLRASILVGLGCIINPWSRPFHACVQHLRDAAEVALRTGDLMFTLTGFQVVSNYLASGRSLDLVEKEAEEGLGLAKRMSYLPMVAVLEDQLRLVRSLRGTSGAYPALSDASRDEATFERELAATPGMPLPDCWYWIRKLTLRVIANDPASAVVAAENARVLLWVSPSNVDVAEHHFYAAIAHAGMCDGSDGGSEVEHRSAVSRYLRQLEIWAEHCPENFENRRLLVSAEVARLDGRDMDAQRLYERAIRSAREGGFLQVEALASELCARFHASRDFPLIADAYLRRARDAYESWGAEAKVAKLESDHPGLAAPARGEAGLGAGLQHLDLATVVRVSQATSQEIILERLVRTLMTTAIEHAGAKRGLLILVRKGELEVSAEASTGVAGTTVELARVSLADRELPLSIVHYVRRTRTGVLLDDATHPSPFSDDEYLRRRGSRSVMCLPLVKQTELVGLLYLENDLAPHVFTPQRFAVLELLASQSAMTIDNALLYAELRQAKAYMSHAERLSQTGTFSWKPSSREIFWSDEVFQIFGVEGASTVDAVRSRIHPQELEQFEALLAAPSRLEEGVLAQRLLMPDGSTKHVTVLARGLPGPDGEIEYVGAIRDVTEAKRSEEALQRTQAALADVSRVATLGEMAAAIAHEVNQPLAAIGLNAAACLRWLRQDPMNGEEAHQSAVRIARDATRANDVIQRIRALFSRSGGERAPVDLDEAIREVVALTRSQVQRSGAILGCELSPEVLLVQADRVQLQQVILNLVVNAADALSDVVDGPRVIEVRTSTRGTDRVEVTVRDTGPGVPRDRAERIFEAFYTTKPSGMGMGLSICRTIVESHGGTLSVESTEGSGATFRLSLPVDAGPAPASGEG